MKKITFIIILLFPLLLVAQQQSYKWEVSTLLGLQSGGAIPVPMSALSGSENAVSVNIEFYPLVTARVSRLLSASWHICTGLSYSTFGISSDARVKNQRIKEFDIESGELRMKYFTGVSHIEMFFTCVELPVYIEYFLSEHSMLLMGLYGAYQLSSKFETMTEKGFAGIHANEMGAEVNTLLISDFSGDLRSWDFGFIAGYEFAVFPRLNVGMHFSYSPIDIFKTDINYFDYNMHPLKMSIILSYKLFRV